MIDYAWWKSKSDEYALAAKGSEFPLNAGDATHACDDREGGATIDAHYALMDLWAARSIIRGWLEAESNHVDVGSRVDGICTHLLASGEIRSVVHVDIRPPPFAWPGFTFRDDDARTLSTFADSSVSSLSCLHAAEHIGLGRYGDLIDPDGMRKCMASLARILAPGGRLYFAVPVGRHRVVFNAHRVASPRWVVDTFASAGLYLESFAAVDDAGRWHAEADPRDFEQSEYACGCFEFARNK